MVNVKSSVRDKLQNSPIWDRLGGDLIFLSLPALLDYILGRRDWAGADAPQPQQPQQQQQQQPSLAAAAVASAMAAKDKPGAEASSGDGAGSSNPGQSLDPMALKALDSLYGEYVDWQI